MPAELTLADLRQRWNEVLDELEATDRIAWLAFFDARIADLTDDVLTLDFSDATTRNVSQIYCIHIISWNIRMDACTYGFTSVH